MTNQRFRDLWRSVMLSLGAGVMSAVAFLLISYFDIRLRYFGIGQVAIVAYGAVAMYFGRLILVPLGSVIVTGCLGAVLCGSMLWTQPRVDLDDVLTTFTDAAGIVAWIFRYSLIAGLIGFSIGTRRRARLRRESNKCPTCEYSLAGLTTPQCPECGSAWNVKLGEKNA